MFLYNRHGAGVNVVVGWHELIQIIKTETLRFYQEHPEQFKNLEEAKEFAPVRFTMLAMRILNRCQKHIPHFEGYTD